MTATTTLERNWSMGHREFDRLSRFIQDECGIKMPPSKKTMLESRLQKRLRLLGKKDFKDYCEFLFSTEGMAEELPHLLDAVTTNTTNFFREPNHFSLLADKLLPGLRDSLSNRALRVWSAACSTGEEAYTLAMVLEEFGARNGGLPYEILATDISNEVLVRGVRAVYDEDKVDPIPAEYRRKYLMRSKDKKAGVVRIVPELRQRVSFTRLNFMEEFALPEQMDVVFCRNCLIYFDRPTQQMVLSRIIRQIRARGFLFLGHSESLTGLNLPVTQIAPTVYIRNSGPKVQ